MGFLLGDLSSGSQITTTVEGKKVHILYKQNEYKTIRFVPL